MRNTPRLSGTWTAIALALSMGSAEAALWDFTLSGVAVYVATPNDYNLVSLSPVTVTGVLDDSVLISGTGVVSFATGNPYGNTFTVTAGAIVFTPDEVYAGTPTLSLSSMTIDYLSGGFGFYASDTTSSATFNSYFNAFDGEDAALQIISGDWLSFSATPQTVVPVPAAAWLLGSGLLGLVGIARRKNIAW